MSEQSKVFLSKISEKIKNGEYDESLDLFVSRELIYSSIKARVMQKLENGSTPLLTDSQIKEAIKDAKEVGNLSFSIFYKLGLIIKQEDGQYIISDKCKNILKNI